MRSLLAALLLVLVSSAVLGQHNHAQHHGEYENWASGKTQNCCNNQDCGVVQDRDVRQSPAGTEIKIADQWCPVLREHWLIRGRSPDWQTAHACVGNSEHWLGRPPCERLLCFTPAGGF